MNEIIEKYPMLCFIISGILLFLLSKFMTYMDNKSGMDGNNKDTL